MIWKQFRDTKYEVSDTGLIRNGKTGKILKASLNDNGYFHVCLCNNNKKSNHSVHRMVAEVFIPNVNKLPEVNHKDEDKTNNSDTNLEWCTTEYNVDYSAARCFEILNPTGNLVKVRNLRRFCKEHGLNVGSISMVLKGTRKHTKGWTKP